MKTSLIAGIAGLGVGLLLGFFGANSLNRGSQFEATNSSTNAPSNPTTVTQVGSGDGAMLSGVSEALENAENEPNNFEAQMTAGEMYSKIGRNDKAIEFFAKGVAIMPTDFTANIVLANAYFDTKQFDAAEKYYAIALEIDPKDVNARTDLGTTYIERQPPDYRRGIEQFKGVLELDPKHEATLYNLGVAYFRSGDLDSAKAALIKLDGANPGNPLAIRLKESLSQIAPIRSLP
ncbi:MAG: tetratricopeptide repeat protein [Pyrinomonadaceae bacterium]